MKVSHSEEKSIIIVPNDNIYYDTEPEINENQNQNQNTKNKKIYINGNIIIVIILAIIGSIYLAIGIPNLVLGQKISEKLNCTLPNKTIGWVDEHIGLNSWMIYRGAIDCTYGIISLTGIFVFICEAYSKSQKTCDNESVCGFFCLLQLCIICSIIMNIFGNILWWHDWKECYDDLPNDVRNWMYARIIISDIFLCVL